MHRGWLAPSSVEMIVSAPRCTNRSAVFMCISLSARRRKLDRADPDVRAVQRCSDSKKTEATIHFVLYDADTWSIESYESAKNTRRIRAVIF